MESRKMTLLKELKTHMKRTTFGRRYVYLSAHWMNYKADRNVDVSKISFFLNNCFHTNVMAETGSKAKQISILLDKVKIEPIKGHRFFYSLDVWTGMEYRSPILDNYTVDYTPIVNSSFKELKEELDLSTEFGKEETVFINSLEKYYQRCIKEINGYEKQLAAIKSLFERPSYSLFEGLQRILFYNQFLWQTSHTLNGLGHLDQILIDLYRNDINKKVLTQDEADALLCDFFWVLHEYYWFKSGCFLGDTGQIIILGGTDEGGNYIFNELTYKFIEISQKLLLPDPKVLLRCNKNMPSDLIEKAIECISTGIGAPFLSNDDEVIPALEKAGYDKEDALNYVTAACWEPLVLSDSSDQNNFFSINFAKPFNKMMESDSIQNISSTKDLIEIYKGYLRAYLESLVAERETTQLSNDPILSLLSKSSMKAQKDLLHGGAKYYDFGATSVGMNSVVNSILNIDKLVFIDKEYSLKEINNIRKENYKNNDILVEKLKNGNSLFGCDDSKSIALTNELIDFSSKVLNKHKTKYGGIFKFGLSSPSYILEAETTAATFDGRKDGEPFGTHISSAKAIAPTELLSFASKLDYSGNKCNGNVVDFFVTPKELKNNIKKYATLTMNAFKAGVYQLQMNVVDSATLIAAKENPESFPNLIVRVWGFSAYFKDLPEEYKDVLIERALQSERV